MNWHGLMLGGLTGAAVGFPTGLIIGLFRPLSMILNPSNLPIITEAFVTAPIFIIVFGIAGALIGTKTIKVEPGK